MRTQVALWGLIAALLAPLALGHIAPRNVAAACQTSIYLLRFDQTTGKGYSGLTSGDCEMHEIVIEQSRIAPYNGPIVVTQYPDWGADGKFAQKFTRKGVDHWVYFTFHWD